MFYAKSKPEVESIKEHTNKLLKAYEDIKLDYGDKIEQLVDMQEERFWELLKIACQYHDLGKANSAFQNRIKKNIGISDKEKIEISDIPHNYLSPAFLPEKVFTKEEYKVLIQSIGYHHERDTEPEPDKIRYIIDNDLRNSIDSLSEEMEMSIDTLSQRYITYLDFKKRINEDSSLYRNYVIIKGLLHELIMQLQPM